MGKKVLIVGGVAGGASCAARLRRLDESAEIVMFEKGEYISFANCGLPYHISGEIEDREELILQTKESFYERFNVDVRLKNEVTAIDRAGKTVKVTDIENGREYTESYDTLVLSTGSSPLKPPIPGIDSEKINVLWTIPDMDVIIENLKKNNVKKAVVVGGGFIGIEMAENLTHAGVKVTIVEMLNQVMAPLDWDMAQMVHLHLVQNGVDLVLGDGVKSFEEKSGGITVNTNGGKALDADMVILAIGVRPNSKLAIDAGLEVNKRGGIIIDESLKTSDENIYAIGDVVDTIDFPTGERTMVPLAGPANKMGRMAADNIAGMKRTYRGTQGSAVAKVFSMTVANTGKNEKQLKALGKEIDKDYKVTITHPGSHAGYYPGALPLTLKMIFDKDTGKVLGAQSVGYDGVDKRIDVLATAINFGATVYDLEEIELCYAPPYSSAKDPVNMSGYYGENILSGTVDNILFTQLKDLNENQVILDVRTEGEVLDGNIEGSINIPVDELRDRLDELDKTKEYVVSCLVGQRAHVACRILMQNGFKNVRNLAGGYVSYSILSRNYSK
ncbi:MAG: FAD-dependent oxidoreductase [Clostridia bacterium]|nr:FAD-dependent oxidoreductase [Clostridia bacterium]